MLMPHRQTLIPGRRNPPFGLPKSFLAITWHPARGQTLAPAAQLLNQPYHLKQDHRI